MNDSYEYINGPSKEGAISPIKQPFAKKLKELNRKKLEFETSEQSKPSPRFTVQNPLKDQNIQEKRTLVFLGSKHDTIKNKNSGQIIKTIICPDESSKQKMKFEFINEVVLNKFVMRLLGVHRTAKVKFLRTSELTNPSVIAKTDLNIHTGAIVEKDYQEKEDDVILIRSKFNPEVISLFNYLINLPEEELDEKIETIAEDGRPLLMPEALQGLIGYSRILLVNMLCDVKDFHKANLLVNPKTLEAFSIDYGQATFFLNRVSSNEFIENIINRYFYQHGTLNLELLENIDFLNGLQKELKELYQISTQHAANDFQAGIDESTNPKNKKGESKGIKYFDIAEIRKGSNITGNINDDKIGEYLANIMNNKMFHLVNDFIVHAKLQLAVKNKNLNQFKAELKNLSSYYKFPLTFNQSKDVLYHIKKEAHRNFKYGQALFDSSFNKFPSLMFNCMHDFEKDYVHPVIIISEKQLMTAPEQSSYRGNIMSCPLFSGFDSLFILEEVYRIQAGIDLTDQDQKMPQVLFPSKEGASKKEINCFSLEHLVVFRNKMQELNVDSVYKEFEKAYVAEIERRVALQKGSGKTVP